MEKSRVWQRRWSLFMITWLFFTEVCLHFMQTVQLLQVGHRKRHWSSSCSYPWEKWCWRCCEDKYELKFYLTKILQILPWYELLHLVTSVFSSCKNVVVWLGSIMTDMNMLLLLNMFMTLWRGFKMHFILMQGNHETLTAQNVCLQASAVSALCIPSVSVHSAFHNLTTDWL